MESAHALSAPSPWIVRWAPLVAPGAEVLDLACGAGRHARHLAARGCTVVAIDRDAEAIAALATVAGVFTRRADLEGEPWPFAPASFDAVVVANYLHRPLFAPILDALRPGGVLLVSRRQGPDAPFFLGHARDREGFEELLAGLGLNDIRSQPWQVDYELVWAMRPLS